MKSSVLTISLSCLFFFLFLSPLQGQNPGQVKDSVYSQVDEQADYPGGESALTKLLYQTMKYPEEAIQKNIEGRVVVMCIIDKGGKITHSEVVKSVHPCLDQEALRTVSLLSGWIPAKKDGKDVSSYYYIPLKFKLVTSDNWVITDKTLVVIDDMIMPEGFDYQCIDKNKIDTVIVHKPFPESERDTLISKYGPKGAFGVIEFKTILAKLPFFGNDFVPSSEKPDEKCTEKPLKPQYFEGENALIKYINNNIKYPLDALERDIQGRPVVGFTITKTGKIENIHMVKSVDKLLDDESIKLVKKMPDWKPATRCGMPIDCNYTLRFTFRIEDETPKKEKLIVLNGKPLPIGFDQQLISFSKITLLREIAPKSKKITAELVSSYGNDAANGVILIETQPVQAK